MGEALRVPPRPLSVLQGKLGEGNRERHFSEPLPPGKCPEPSADERGSAAASHAECWEARRDHKLIFALVNDAATRGRQPRKALL